MSKGDWPFAQCARAAQGGGKGARAAAVATPGPGCKGRHPPLEEDADADERKRGLMLLLPSIERD